MEITYHWEGDYLIPDLKLSDTTEYNIGKYGRMRRRFLEENHRGIYSHMLLSETLWKHLAEIDEECNEMMDRLVGQMAQNEGVTEQLKSEDWLCWLASEDEQHQEQGGRSCVARSDIFPLVLFWL